MGDHSTVFGVDSGGVGRAPLMSSESGEREVCWVRGAVVGAADDVDHLETPGKTVVGRVLVMFF